MPTTLTVADQEHMPRPVAKMGIVAHSRELKEQAYQIYKATHDYERASLETGIPGATIRSWCSRESWETRMKAEAVAPGLDAETTRQVVRVVTSASTPDAIPGADDDLPEQQARFNRDTRAQALRLPQIMAEMSDRDMVSAADKLSKLHAIAEKALKLTESKGNVLVQIALLSAPTERTKCLEMASD